MTEPQLEANMAAPPLALLGVRDAVAAHEQAGRRAELHVRGICKRFGAVEVLRSIDFSVQQGEFVTLLGPSGCGKTTLLRILAGLELADAGTVVLGGSDITALPANRRPVNTVFQSYALFPHLNVFENVAFGLRARRFAQAEIDRRVADALRMLHLEAFGRRPVQPLSGGERQRVALARALVNEPDVLLLDEPMSALDAKLRSEVQIELRSLQRRLGKTFILVTHDQDEAMTVSDRILVMRQGAIEQVGPPMEVYEHPVNRFVAGFLGLANLIPGRAVEGGVQTALGLLKPRTRPAWTEGTLAVRPERVQIVASAPPVNAVKACVREIIFRGDHLDVFLDPGRLRVHAPAGLPLRIAQEVFLRLPSEHLETLLD